MPAAFQSDRFGHFAHFQALHYSEKFRWKLAKGNPVEVATCNDGAFVIGELTCDITKILTIENALINLIDQILGLGFCSDFIGLYKDVSDMILLDFQACSATNILDLQDMPATGTGERFTDFTQSHTGDYFSEHAGQSLGFTKAQITTAYRDTTDFTGVNKLQYFCTVFQLLVEKLCQLVTTALLRTIGVFNKDMRNSIFWRDICLPGL